jgi:uncharacterized membrane protein
MNTFIDLMLGLHVLFGMIALVVAPGAMITRKGGAWHRRWGRIYFWSMAVVALTAVALSLIRSGLFLLLMAIFSFYLALTGVRALRRKRPNIRADAGDWSAAGLAFVGSLGLVGYGAWWLISGTSFGVVALAFGGLGGAVAGGDLWRFRHPPEAPRTWFFLHMTRMLAAYIATVSAFSAVNFMFLPPVIRWLWPTVIGSIGIAIWVRHYRARFASRPAPNPN